MNVMPTPARRRAAPTASVAVALVALVALAACSGGDDTAADPASGPDASGTPSDAPSPSATEETRGYPAYAPRDYTYLLEVLCYCPQVGKVEVEVRDGEVVEATSTTGEAKGSPAPDFARLTIADIVDQANSLDHAEVEMTWPEGQDHPSKVRIDRIAQAVDDEVTYTISQVSVE